MVLRGGCYDKCCWIFCSKTGFGYAPTSVSTCRPSLKNRILGIERTLKRVDANQKTAMRFNVRSIPSILFFKDGRHVDTLVGAYPKPVFEQKIQQHLS